MQAEASHGTATAGARAAQGAAASYSVPTPHLSATTVQTTAAPAMGGNAANAVRGAGGSAALSLGIPLGMGAAARLSPELTLSDGAAGVARVGVRVG